MAANILVTGAAGTVGRQLVQELSGRGVRVRAAIHSTESADDLQHDLVEIVEFDFNDASTFEDALADITKVYLISPEIDDPLALIREFIDAAVSAGVHLIRQSRFGAQTGEIGFSRRHNEVEQYIVGSGITYTFLRPNTFMQDFITEYVPSGGVIYLPMGHGEVSYVDVRDIVLTAAEILTQEAVHEGKSYTLTGPRAVAVADVAQIMSDASGVHISYVDIPDETARHALETSGYPGWLVDALLEMHGRNRDNYAATVTQDVQNVTGRSPRNIEQFAQDYAEMIRDLTQQEHPQNV